MNGATTAVSAVAFGLAAGSVFLPPNDNGPQHSCVHFLENSMSASQSLSGRLLDTSLASIRQALNSTPAALREDEDWEFWLETPAVDYRSRQSSQVVARGVTHVARNHAAFAFRDDAAVEVWYE